MFNIKSQNKSVIFTITIFLFIVVLSLFSILLQFSDNYIITVIIATTVYLILLLYLNYLYVKIFYKFFKIQFSIIYINLFKDFSICILFILLCRYISFVDLHYGVSLNNCENNDWLLFNNMLEYIYTNVSQSFVTCDKIDKHFVNNTCININYTYLYFLKMFPQYYTFCNYENNHFYYIHKYKPLDSREWDYLWFNPLPEGSA